MPFRIVGKNLAILNKISLGNTIQTVYFFNKLTIVPLEMYFICLLPQNKIYITIKYQAQKIVIIV